MEKKIMLVLVLFTAELHFNSAVPTESKNLICGSKPADVVFVLDSSGSIWEQDFLRQIQFVIDVVSQFPVGRDLVQVGAVSFSNWAQLEFHLKDFHDKSQIDEALMNMVQMKGDTNTAAALAFVQDVMLTSEYGARPKVPHIVVVLTDGKSNHPVQTAFEAERAKQRSNVHLFAIGVGTQVDREELYRIASQPQDQYVFTVENYQALETIRELLAVKACQVTNKPTTIDPLIQPDQACGFGVAADVVFAGSPSADETETSKTMTFFRDIASRLDISEDKVHVGLVPKDCDAFPEIGLDKWSGKKALAKELRQLQKRLVPSTASVIRYLNDVSFAQEPRRQNARRIGVIVVDGPIDAMQRVIREAAKTKQTLGVELFVVGVGKHVSADDLKSLASSPSANHIFHVSSYDDLKSIVDQFTSSICPVTTL